ncbi:MAG: superoxide dismutase [Clostridiaceae bacterium]
MLKLEPKIYDFSKVKGISLKQLQEHYKLYTGYVNKLNEIWNMPNDAKAYGEGNSTYSNMRSLKLGETYALDGVKLHELYFQIITSGYRAPFGEIESLIKRDFKSLENFYEYLRKVGTSVRGWAVLVIDPIDNRLHVIGSDAHDTGVVWCSYPLLVLDVYEHAYFHDFGTDRKKYIDVFLRNVNWGEVNNRLKKYYSIKPFLGGNRQGYDKFTCPMGYYKL